VHEGYRKKKRSGKRKKRSEKNDEQLEGREHGMVYQHEETLAREGCFAQEVEEGETSGKSTTTSTQYIFCKWHCRGTNRGGKKGS